MALKAKLAKLEELGDQLDVLKGLYVEASDGTFVLDAEGVEDVTGLKRSLESEREEAKKLRARLAKLRDIDPDEYTTLKEQQRKAEEERLREAGEYKALEQQMKERHAAEMTKKDGREKSLLGQIENLLVDQQATEAISRVSKRVKALLPHVKRQVKVVEQDGRFRAVIVDESGNERIADGKGTPMTFEVLLGEMKQDSDFAPLFDSEGQSGSGAPAGGIRGPVLQAGKPMVLSREDKRDPEKYRAAKAAAEKAGVALVLEE